MNYELQLQWIRDLQHALRSLWMDRLFNAWHYVDTGYFTILVIVLIWYLWDRRIGIRLFYILALSSAVNHVLKAVFHQPRPCQMDPLVGLLCGGSPGLPSGAAQTAAILGGLVILECKTALNRSLGLLFALFLCFSRIYLGVHFFTDIVGGLIVGCLLLLVYKKVFPLFEKRWKIAAVCFPFSLLLLPPLFSLSWRWDLYLCFASLGLAVGLITYAKMKIRPEKNRDKQWAQVFTVLGGICVLLLLEEVLPKMEILCFFAEGFWVSFLGGWLIQRKKAG